MTHTGSIVFRALETRMDVLKSNDNIAYYSIKELVLSTWFEKQRNIFGIINIKKVKTRNVKMLVIKKTYYFTITLY